MRKKIPDSLHERSEHRSRYHLVRSQALVHSKGIHERANSLRGEDVKPRVSSEEVGLQKRGYTHIFLLVCTSGGIRFSQVHEELQIRSCQVRTAALVSWSVACCPLWS